VPVQRVKPIRGRLVTAAVVVLALLGILAPDANPTAASAAPTCAERVVADWSDDGLIAGTYEIACYRDALHILPEDVLIYSSALDDISRAMREALDEQKGAAATESGASRRLSGRGPAATGEDGVEAAAEAAPALVPDETSASRTPPLPLLLMAVLTLVLVLAGSAGLLARRLRRR
jgi:hypothetical protein